MGVASYSRDVSIYAGAANPYINDLVSASLVGLLSRRVSFSANASFALGRTAIGIDNGYRGITGTAHLGYQVTRYVPLFGEYVYYNYQFERPVGLAQGFPLLVDRHGLRFGLSYSVPLIGRRPGT